jgi:hypothetical protein
MTTANLHSLPRCHGGLKLLPLSRSCAYIRINQRLFMRWEGAFQNVYSSLGREMPRNAACDSYHLICLQYRTAKRSITKFHRSVPHWRGG